MMQRSPNISVIPKHVAIIMDGNGRWAKRLGKSRTAGHQKGVSILQDVVKIFAQQKVDYLTLFAFSSENWLRPKSEVKFLISLFSESLENELDNLHQQGVRLCFIGDPTPFPKKLQKVLLKAQQTTQNNDVINVTIAVNYGGRWDIKQSFEKIAEQLVRGEIAPADISESMIDANLSTYGVPDVDLLIRSGGEQRISNFLLWQCAYAELCFVDQYWPDFDQQTVLQCLELFAKRQRRYGKTGEQIDNEQSTSGMD